MIFVSLGSQKFQFNRLLQKIDELIEDEIITEEVYAQIGYSDYKPKHYKYEQFLNREEFIKFIDKSDTVITHGGTGAIISSVKKGKKVIAVARLSQFGEHVDDHQIDIVNQFKEMNLIEGVVEIDDLSKALMNSHSKKYNKYQSNNSKIISIIENFINS